MLFVRSQIMDEQTGEPVRAEVYVTGPESYLDPQPIDLVYADVTSFELALFGDLDSWLVVLAPGYRPWHLRLQFNLKTSRELAGPVRLRRVGSD